MALTGYFYHETLRKYIIAFGTIFNNFTITRKDDRVISIPIAYGSKQKWMARMQANPNLDKPHAVTLPRISFIITNLMYDTERKISSIGKMWRVNETDNTVAQKIFNPVPYNIDISLTIYAKNMSDFLQIFEQILPFFKPQFTITIEDIEGIETLHDIPIILNDVSVIHDSEGSVNEFRVINCDLNFTMKGYFYGPIKSQSLIRKVIVDTRLGETKFNDPDSQPETRQIVEPDPLTAFADDDYGFTESTEYFPEGPPVPLPEEEP